MTPGVFSKGAALSSLHVLGSEPRIFRKAILAILEEESKRKLEKIVERRRSPFRITSSFASLDNLPELRVSRDFLHGQGDGGMLNRQTQRSSVLIALLRTLVLARFGI